MKSMDDSPMSVALRSAGYVPLPRLWVTQEQLDLIYYMARQNTEHVNAIRVQSRNSDADKQAQIDLAWKTKENGDGK